MGASAFGVQHLGTTDSTNDWLLDAARDGAADRTVAVADFQRRGRGRLDRRWEAPAGSALLCSVLLRVVLEPVDRHLCSAAVGLAACEASDTTAGVRPRLKWPNDLVVSDRKLGGILAEADGRPDAAGATAVVVGIGLNLTWPGPPEAGGTSLLEASGADVARDAFLDAFLAALEPRDAALREERSRATLVAEYRASLATLGRRVRVELVDHTIEGVAVDVTDGGLLVVDGPSGRRTIAAGDVVHLRDAVDGGAGPHG